jgi:hypothetical protein
VAPICEGAGEDQHAALRSAAAEARQEEGEVSGVGCHSASFGLEAIVVKFRRGSRADSLSYENPSLHGRFVLRPLGDA